MKSISGALENHLSQEVTSLARCWKIVRTDGQVFRFTAHDSDIALSASYSSKLYGLGYTSVGGAPFTALRLYFNVTGSGSSIGQTIVKTYAPVDIDATWTQFAGVTTFMYDSNDGHVIFFVASADVGLSHLQYVVKANSTTGAIVWKTPYENSPGSAEQLPGNPDYGANNINLTWGVYKFIDTHGNVYSLDCSTGTLTKQFYDGSLSAGYQTWDSRLNLLIFHGSYTPSGISNQWAIFDAATQSFYKIVFDQSVLTATPQDSDMAIDPINRRGFFMANGIASSTVAGVHVVDLATGIETANRSWSGITDSTHSGFSSGMHLSMDGYLWVWTDEGNYSPWIKIDPNTLTLQGQIGGVAGAFDPANGDTPDSAYVTPFGYFGQARVFMTGLFTSMNILDETSDINVFALNTVSDTIVRICGGTTLTSETYLAAVGFSNSAVENKSDLSVDNQDIQGIFDSDTITLADLRAGAFDYADVYIFFVNWQDSTQGILKLRRGKLGEVTSSPQGWFTVELRGMTQLLQQQIVELYGPECRADLFDSRCGLLSTAYQCTGHVVSVTDGTHIVIALDTTAANYTASDQWFQYGQVHFISGANEFKTLEIKTWNHTSLIVQFYVPAGYPIQVGDNFTITPGCDKTQPTCKTVFNNLVNFRGEPFIPGNDAAFTYPDVGS